jgi:hypothetical protein
MSPVPETLNKDAQCEKLHRTYLQGTKVGYTLVCASCQAGDFGEDVQLVVFSVKALDGLDTLYRVRNVFQSRLQFIRLLLGPNGQSMSDK